jgi:3-hydroxy-9,10-secoandrosta-1,3,5(10)-triene-9,17-dione monooxygenase
MNQPMATLTAQSVIEAARALVPYLRDEAARCEAERRVSDRTIEKLLRAGLFDVVKPRRYGGLELGWDVFAEAVIAIASGCGSTGWVYSVVGGHAPVVARFGTAFLDELWGPNPAALVSSSRRSAGELTPVAGGYRGSGTAAYSSGCLNVDWVLIEGMPVAGETRPLTIVMPVADVEILDTWHAIGLAGTGSHDFRFRDAFVPAHRTWFPGKPPVGDALDGPLFRTPYLGGPFALPSVVLGIAIAGLEHFAALTQGRPARQGGGLADQQSMQMRMGESAVEVDAALALLRVKLTEVMAALSGAPADRSGERAVLPPGGASHGHDLAASSFFAHTAYGALNRLMVAAGAGQLALSEPFQRCFRDALAGIQQPSNNWDNGRTAGGRELFQHFAAAGGSRRVRDDAPALRSSKQIGRKT